MELTNEYSDVIKKSCVFGSEMCSLGYYLLDRLQERGIDEIFGVPGDYVLQFNKVNEQHQVRFINTTRESTAGHMACAYAKLKGIGAVCVTYGVGINVLNAVTQAYVESTPLVIISGAPGISEYSRQQRLHHLFDKLHPDGEREHIQCDIFKQVTVDQVVLNDPHTAANLIQRALDRCIKFGKPVYIELPRDSVHVPITPVSGVNEIISKCDPMPLNECLAEIQKCLLQSQRPVIWAGHGIQLYRLSKDLTNFSEKFHIPIATSIQGRSAISERHPNFIGVYQGALSKPEVIKEIENSDCLIQLGVLLTDVETGLFTTKLEQKIKIIADNDIVTIGHHQYEGVMLQDLLKGFASLTPIKGFSERKITQTSTNEIEFIPKETPITTERLFKCLRSHVKSEHIIVTDFGDCLFGSEEFVLEENSFIAFPYFASLGFGVPGAIGAQIASPDRRVIGIVGDGAFQISGTELSTAVRYHLDPIIIVINNHGYGTERPLLEGSYNDLQDWNYSELPKLLGGGKGFKVETEYALEDAISQALAKRGQFYLIEVPVDKLDFSPAMQRFTEVAKKLTRK